MTDPKIASILLKKNLIQYETSVSYKKKRFARIAEAVDMMMGKVKPKPRQQFNVPLPVLSGLFDTLCADLDDPILLKVKNKAGKNLEAVKGINDSINMAKKSLRNNARWDYKDRMSRRYAITYGRAILKYFSVANPYSNTLEVINPLYFHCQARGGGILERHLFAGEEGIIKTKKQLETGASDGFYDSTGIKLLTEKIGDEKYQEKISSLQEGEDQKFRALGLDPKANSYIGEPVSSLCEWVSNYNGERYVQVFDPIHRIWIRTEKLTDLYSSGYYPWVSYATHEDDDNFWSTSILADILFPIAESMITMFNQELTNRQKRNLNSRLYDKDMVRNVSKLDEAQYRPDALVPVDTLGGKKRLSEAVYSFETPGLTGTIDMINWLDEFTGKQTGIYQNAPSHAGGKKTNNIVYAEIQQMAKRVDYRSHSYTECWGELMIRHIQGLKDNLTQEEAFDMLGSEVGFNFVKDLKGIKVDKDDVEIISTKQQAQEDALRKTQKEKALSMLAQDEGINSDWKRRQILSDIGGWESDEIDDALDLRGQGVERNQLAAADEAIKALIKGKEPEICWNATTIFMRKILDFAVGHRKGLENQYPMFLEYLDKHAQIVAQNMAQLALRTKPYAPPVQPGEQKGQPEQGSPEQGQIKPAEGKTMENMPTPTANAPRMAMANQR